MPCMELIIENPSVDLWQTFEDLKILFYCFISLTYWMIRSEDTHFRRPSWSLKSVRPGGVFTINWQTLIGRRKSEWYWFFTWSSIFRLSRKVFPFTSVKYTDQKSRTIKFRWHIEWLGLKTQIFERHLGILKVSDQGVFSL